LDIVCMVTTTWSPQMAGDKGVVVVGRIWITEDFLDGSRKLGYYSKGTTELSTSSSSEQ
jgi:hypothetical protein